MKKLLWVLQLLLFVGAWNLIFHTEQTKTLTMVYTSVATMVMTIVQRGISDME